MPVGDVCRQVGIAEQTFYRWKKEYAGMLPSEARELKQLRDKTPSSNASSPTCLCRSVVALLACLHVNQDPPWRRIPLEAIALGRKMRWLDRLRQHGLAQPR